MIHGTIRADGIDWSAQTYIEALGFREIDRFEQPAFEAEARFVIIDRRLEIHAPQYASQIHWHDVLAVRPLDYTSEAAPCRLRARPSMSRTDDLCADCDDERDDFGMCC